MKICKNCDLLFEDTVGFCTKCGKKLENFQNDIHDINIDTELNTFSDNSSNAENRSVSNNTLVIALIISALLIGGMGGYILFGRSSNNNDSVTIPATDSTQQVQQTTKPHEADSAQNPRPGPRSPRSRPRRCPRPRPALPPSGAYEARLCAHGRPAARRVRKFSGALSRPGGRCTGDL